MFLNDRSEHSEKRKTEGETKVEDIELPRLQKSLFPNFEQDFPVKAEKVLELDVEITESTSDILLRIAADFQKLAQKLKACFYLHI